jgi:hypothetical protein
MMLSTVANSYLVYQSALAATSRLVDWLYWGEADVSELRPLRVYYSSPGDCDVDHGMMLSTVANS